MANWPDELRDVVDEIQAALGPEDKLILFREITYGFSKSRVFLVDIESGKHDYSGMAILKVTQGNMPDGMAFESRKLQQALEGSLEGFAERHLPRLVFCHKSEKFSAVFTSVVSGSLESVEPLIKLGAKQLTAALFSISKKLLDEWNPDYSWREDSTPLWDTLPAWLEKKSGGDTRPPKRESARRSDRRFLTDHLNCDVYYKAQRESRPDGKVQAAVAEPPGQPMAVAGAPFLT